MQGPEQDEVRGHAAGARRRCGPRSVSAVERDTVVPPDDGVDVILQPYIALRAGSVSVSMMGAPFGSETITASDDDAARADEVQLDLGEGPIWQARTTRAPVVVSDLASAETEAWPAAALALRAVGVRSVSALPMRIGGMDVGCVSLYSTAPVDLSSVVVTESVRLARVTAWQVLHIALRRAETERPGEWNAGKYARREIHQAAGMVAVQTGGTPDDALLLLRAAAFAGGRSLLDVSADVLDRVIDFTSRSGPDAAGRNEQ